MTWATSSWQRSLSNNPNLYFEKICKRFSLHNKENLIIPTVCNTFISCPRSGAQPGLRLKVQSQAVMIRSPTGSGDFKLEAVKSLTGCQWGSFSEAVKKFAVY